MKKISKLIVLFILIISMSGCLKMDSFEGASIYTTVYPIEYITDRLYGTRSEIRSIYPNGINVDDYKLNKKQIKDYSKSDLFIFNGLVDEKKYVELMFNNNKHLKIIDSTQSMEFVYGIEELWLNPSNLLMIAQNIRTGFNEYIDNHYLKSEIDDNYNQLKIELSNLDAKIKSVVENSDSNTIVVSSDLYKYLEKYNFNVISLEENDDLTTKKISEVKKLINKGEIKYIFIKQNEEINNTISQIKDETGVELVTLHSLTNLTSEEKNDKKDYLSIMNDNIDLIKNELYN